MDEYIYNEPVYQYFQVNMNQLIRFVREKYGEDKLEKISHALGKLTNFTIDAAFDDVLGKDGTVINTGTINASLGGNVALISRQAKNAFAHIMRYHSIAA